MGGDSVPAPVFRSKEELYSWLEKEVTLLVDGLPSRFTPEARMMVALSNVAAVCYHTLNHHHAPEAPLHRVPVNWFGFYLLQAPGVLGLGPFQGRPACMSIQVGRGVCGAAAQQRQSLVVEDVHAFPGHIACDSASSSEIVVPILSNNGSVVGVIDVDSIQLGLFDEVDRRGLEAVAGVLQKFVRFPMTRVVEMQPDFSTAAAAADPVYTLPSYAFGPDKPHPTGDSLFTRPGLTSTKLPTALPAVRIEANRKLAEVARALPAVVEEHEVAGWHFQSTTQQRITNEAENKAMEQHTGVSLLPEIMYRNELRITDSSGVEVLHFHMEPLLRSARQFYRTPYYAEKVKEDLKLPLSKSWEGNRVQRLDAGIDWAWRNDFCGLPETSRHTLQPISAEEAAKGMCINWELLRDQAIPIRFYTNMTFFEDDLHDSGDVECTLKMRVMDNAFFVLFRYSLFLHDQGQTAGGVVRELRFFHEFGKAHPSGTFPLVIVEEKLTSLAASIPEETTEENPRRKPSVEEMIAKGTVRRNEAFFVAFAAKDLT